jgi:hypothetical protein
MMDIEGNGDVKEGILVEIKGSTIHIACIVVEMGVTP